MTCTDMASMCGHHPQVALRNYGCKTTRNLDFHKGQIKKNAGKNLYECSIFRVGSSSRHCGRCACWRQV